MRLNDLKNEIANMDKTEFLLKTGLIQAEDEFTGNKLSCPLHSDSTPSLHVYEGDRGFYCFSCGLSGDLISLVAKFLDLKYTQAAAYIADKLGLKVEFTKLNPFTDKPSIDLTAQWETYKKDFITAAKENPQILEGAKIFKPLDIGWNKKNGYYVLALTNKLNQPVGFTQRRSFNTDDPGRYPKWKHSSKKNSRLSECGRTFNLGSAILSIRETGRVIIVEGPKDCIPFIKEGHKNVIATLGTHNVNVFGILPQINHLTICYDGDLPGQNATRDLVRSIATKLPLNEVMTVNFGEDDPYDYYNKNKSLPKPVSVLIIFSNNDLKELYKLSSPYNKKIVTEELMKRMNLTYIQAEDYLNMNLNPVKLDIPIQLEDNSEQEERLNEMLGLD